MQTFDHSLIRTQEHYPVNFGLGTPGRPRGIFLGKFSRATRCNGFPRTIFYSVTVQLSPR